MSGLLSIARRPAAVALLLAIGCLRPHAPPSPWNVSSVASDYSPTLSVVAAIAPVPPGDSLAVRIDSGVLAVPGELRDGSRAIMRDLTVTALVVAPTTGGVDSTGVPRPWTPLAWSAPLLLADSMRYGEQRAVGALELRLPAPPQAGAARWLVLRVDGTAHGDSLRLQDGSVLPGRDVAGGIRVFACAAWNLDGRTDKPRVRAMRARYSSAC